MFSKRTIFFLCFACSSGAMEHRQPASTRRISRMQQYHVVAKEVLHALLGTLYANGTYEFVRATYDMTQQETNPTYTLGMVIGVAYTLATLWAHQHTTVNKCQQTIRRDPLTSAALPLSIIKDVGDFLTGTNVLTGDLTPERLCDSATMGIIRGAAGQSRVILLLANLFGH